MAEFTVTASELNTKAAELERLNNVLEKSIQELETQDASLSKMWEGDAKEAFSNAFKADKAKMMIFHAEITKYIAALRKIAAKYEVAERTNVATASSS